MRETPWKYRPSSCRMSPQILHWARCPLDDPCVPVGQTLISPCNPVGSVSARKFLASTFWQYLSISQNPIVSNPAHCAARANPPIPLKRSRCVGIRSFTTSQSVWCAMAHKIDEIASPSSIKITNTSAAVNIWSSAFISSRTVCN